MALTTDQIAAYKAMLEAERDRISASLGVLNDRMVISGVSDPEGDIPSEVGSAAAAIESHDRGAQIASHERRLLEEIEAALRRIEQGTYGICVESGEPIPTDRLDALPWADRRIEHVSSH